MERRIIAVVGSRRYKDLSQVTAYLNQKRGELKRVITGGAPGVDSTVEEWCRLNNVQ